MANAPIWVERFWEALRAEGVKLKGDIQEENGEEGSREKFRDKRGVSRSG